ncbi:serine hydrolase domain-containing protein [Spongiimicrobium sp. 2-473A-2-J]|uniref:serine hydrolase domain-containing protein n=1 Tax=Eudoraea algarum TaxID=3417568 RepID=UPI003D36B706
MKKLLLGIFLVAIVISCKDNKKERKFENSSDEISNIVEENAITLLKDERFHSVSIAVVKDEIEISKHYGELEIGKENPPNDSTVYEIASVTKTFLGTIAAKAVLDGKINLNDDVRIYLEQSYPNLEFDKKPVTIKHLLTHTSGFPNFPIKGENKPDFFEGLKEIKIESKIGSNYAYSNTAPELMAYIIEKVYDMPYEQLLSKYIFVPNEMKSTKFDLNEEEQSRLIKGYNDENELMPNFKRNLWGGTVGLHSTTSDLLKYIRLQLDETNPIIKESHKEFLETPYDFSIGYHWNIIKENDNIIYRHHGGIFGMQNWLMIYPKYNMGVSILSNTSFDETGDILEEIAENIAEEIKDLKKID